MRFVYPPTNAVEVNLQSIKPLRGAFRVLGPEEAAIGGDAPKNLVTFDMADPFRNAWIAKAARKHGPKECVTEYLIGRIGELLPLRVATCQLVRLPSKGSVDVRFMSKFFLKRHKGQQLSHGIELVARCFNMDEERLKKDVAGRAAERSFYTVEIIDGVLREIAMADEPTYRSLADAFARMMAYDALVGANDRHPRNWGVIENVIRATPIRFSPLFDTARGLFWNHSDAQLLSQPDREKFIKNYAERSTPLIGIANGRDPNHFDVIGRLVEIGDGRFRRPVLEMIEAFDTAAISRLLHEDFSRYFSSTRLGFIDTLLRLRQTTLRKVVSG